MPVYQLDDGIWFPKPKYGEPDGLLAVGGDLSPERLLFAYSLGIFPWFSFKDFSEPHWYCPLERFVIFPKEIHVSHSMKQMMRNARYEVTINQCFEGVIRNCSQVDSRHQLPGAWLGKDMIEAYTKLHQMGRAMSVEVWDVETENGERKTENGELETENGELETESSLLNARRLIGGLYGVLSGNVFCGESMFSKEASASKLALITLAKCLQRVPNSLIDCQFETPHLRSMGGRHISYEEYMDIMNKKTTEQQ